MEIFFLYNTPTLWYLLFFLLNWNIQQDTTPYFWITDIGFDRFTFSFTVKDSPDYFINVSAWGNDGFINVLSGSFNIGECGEQCRAQELWRAGSQAKI